MLPEEWLTNQRIRKLRQKFPSQSREAFAKLAQHEFGTTDLNRIQLSNLVQILTDVTEWPLVDHPLDHPEPDTLGVVPPHADATPEWFLTGLSMLFDIQSGSSVLDLFCGSGSLGLILPAGALYEGHDSDQKRIDEAKRAFPNGHFLRSDLRDWVSLEPNNQYGLVFAHVPAGLSVTSVNPCLSMQRGPTIDMRLAAVEMGAKFCAPGGYLVILLDMPIRDPRAAMDLNEWTGHNGTLLMNLGLPEGKQALIYRHGIRRRDHQTLMERFVEEQTFLDFCVLTETPTRIAVAGEDPRPVELKDWEIQMVSNPIGKHYSPGKTSEALLYKQNGRVGVRWKTLTQSLEWAMHQAGTAPREEPWTKTVERFEQRFTQDRYLRMRGQDSLNVILNLPEEYQVVEDPALVTFIEKLGRRQQRTGLCYPEKATLENRYYTLGPGNFLLKDPNRYEVIFSEPDFSGAKPPRLHLELTQ